MILDKCQVIFIILQLFISYDLKCRIVVLPKTEQKAPSKVKEGFVI